MKNVYLILLTLLICANGYADNYPVNGLLTNQYDKTLDINQQVMIYVPPEIAIIECDNLKLSSAWTTRNKTPYVVVLPPGPHLFVLGGVYSEGAIKETGYVVDPQNAEIFYNFLPGHIYDLTYERGKEVEGSRKTYTKKFEVKIDVIDRTDSLDEYWLNRIEAIKNYQFSKVQIKGSYLLESKKPMIPGGINIRDMRDRRYSDNIIWGIENDTLFLNGTGAIPTPSGQLPIWYDFRNSFKSVVVGEGITKIGSKAFSSLNIHSVIIAESVTDIGVALSQCKNLSVVEVRCDVPPKTRGFTFVSKAKLIVPVGTKSVYEQNIFWKKFGTIEEKNKEIVKQVNDLSKSEWELNNSSTTTTEKESQTTMPKKQVPEGKLTSDITWQIENDTLFISGIGEIPDVGFTSTSSWYDLGNFFTSAVIGEGITKIGKSAFSMLDKIHSIIIAESVTSINNFAFSGCEKLSIIEVKSDVPPQIAKAAFDAWRVSKAKLIVPAGSKNLYETNKQWSKFKTIEEK